MDVATRECPQCFGQATEFVDEQHYGYGRMCVECHVDLIWYYEDRDRRIASFAPDEHWCCCCIGDCNGWQPQYRG